MIHKELMNTQVKYAKLFPVSYRSNAAVHCSGFLSLLLLSYTYSLRCYMEKASNVSFNHLEQTRANLLLDVCNAAYIFTSTPMLHFLAVRLKYQLVSLTDLIQLIIKILFQLVS